MGYLDLNQVWTIVSFSRFESRFYRFGLAFQLPLPFLVRFLRTTSTIAAPTRLYDQDSLVNGGERRRQRLLPGVNWLGWTPVTARHAGSGAGCWKVCSGCGARHTSRPTASLQLPLATSL